MERQTFSRNVVFLKNANFERKNGQACMPTASELSTIKKTVQLGQFKKDVIFEASMSEDGIKKKLEETFPYLENKRFSCAAVVKLDKDSSRFEFHGSPHIWRGKTIRSKIKGNSALYILEDETSLLDETEIMEIDESPQGATGCPDARHPSSCTDFDQGNGEQTGNRDIHQVSTGDNTEDFFSSADNDTTSGISLGSDHECSEEVLPDTVGVKVNINPKESPLEGGLFCNFTFNPELHPEVISGRANFGNLGTVELERLRNGSLLGTIPASPVPGLVTVKLFSQVGIYLGETEIKYYGMEEVLQQIVYCPDYLKTIFEEYDRCYSLQGANPETSGGGVQNSGTLGFTQPVLLLRALVYTAAKVGAQQFIEMIFTSSAGKVVFGTYKDSSTLPEVIARDHGNEKIANYLEDITKRLSEEIRTGQECSQIINWSELVKAAEAMQKQLCHTSEEENYQLESDISKDTGYLGDVETSSNESFELKSFDSEDDTPSTFNKADTVGQQDEIQLERNLEDHNEDTRDQHKVEIKPFAADTVRQEDEIQVERNLLEDHNEDTIYQHEVEIKPFAGPLPGKPCVDIKDNDSSQIDKLQKTISDMLINHKLLPTMCKHLEEEVLKVRARMKKLEEKLSNATQKNRDVEQECSKLRARNLELEEDIVSRSRQQHRDSSQENLDSFVDHTKEYISDATSNDLDTDQTREHIMNVQLKKLKEELDNNVTSLLRVPEVRLDKLKTSVKLDRLTKLSESLHEIYSEIQRMVAEACKCKEDLKRDFYDFAYHGLRAEHNDLVHRVNDLELVQAEMSDEEKKEFERLQTYQNNRRRQVERLEKLWRGLFTLPESLPEKTCSAPCGGGDNSKKTSRRKCTDPGARPKQIKPLGQATRSGTSDDDKFEVSFAKSKKTSMKSIFKKKESNDDVCYPVSYFRYRDS